MVRARAALVVLIGVLIASLIGFPVLVGWLTEWYWFQSIGFDTVFLTALWTKIGVGLVGGVFISLFLWINLRLAQRGIVPELTTIRGPGSANIDLNAILRRLSIPVSVGLGMLGGLSLSSTWLVLLRFVNRTPFGVADPVYGRDISYYFFTLPVLSIVVGVAITLIVLSLLLTIPIYVLRRDVVIRQRNITVEASAERHLAVLLAALFGLAAVTGYFIDLPSLLYSTTGPLVGASYADLAVQAPLIKATVVVALIAVVMVLRGAIAHRLGWWAGMAGALYFIFGVIAGRGVPALYQRLVVTPNELTKETSQLVHHIEATQRAWGLDEVTTRELTGEASLTRADIEANEGTITNVRLWDREPLLQTFRQLQEIRTYYDFASVDDDRYWIDGKYRQVLLSPRELDSQSLPQRSFINERLAFTHGMGLTLSPVNQVTKEGLPVLFIKDLPPSSDVSLEIRRPGIYYGELSNDYVFVNTNQQEFDYPSGEGGAFTAYDGTGGVSIGSLWRRLLFSMRFGALKILLSNDLTDESRVLFHRRIAERVGLALPFLLLDADPYIVITDDGNLKWIVDAYTSSDRYPYAQPLRDGTNYLRNSVKVVVDAYDGSITAYIADPDDPLIQTYAKVFVDVFRPMEEMPADLRAHIRYPDDLFRVQTSMYTTYHMSDPETFYHREDQWQIPALARGETSRDPFQRHMIMRLPGESSEEFIVMTPFTPRQKDNLAAWMVARSDGEQYGQLVVYRFPRQSLVFGPNQVANRMNQNTEISRQLSLWDQRGSEVVFGNLLVIPIEEALIFVRAIYLRAEGGRIPELKRVVVAYQNQVVMEETLQEGLAQLFGTGPGPAPTDLEAPGQPAPQPPAQAGTPQEASELIAEAGRRYRRAVAAQREGNWAAYGEEIRRLGEVLEQLRATTGEGP
jgi:uncharacterized membrane protein (UPF0182 family)